MSIPSIKPVSPVAKVPARAKRPIGKTCLTCQGRGWTQAKPSPTNLRPPKVQCFVCHGKGRVVA